MCTLAASVKNILVRPDPVDDGETQVLATCDQGLCPLRGVSGTARSGFFLGEPLRLYRAPVGAEEGSQLFRGDIAVPIWDSWSASVYFKSGCAVFRLVGDQVTLVAGNPTTAGEEDGPGPEARFEAGHLPGQPGQLASDGAGSIIYAGGETLRRIRLPGAWRAVAPVVAAGGAAAGGADGAAAAADGAPDDVALVATLGDLALYHVDTQSVAYVPAPQPPQPPPQQQQAGGGGVAAGGGAAGRLVYGSTYNLDTVPLPLPLPAEVLPQPELRPRHLAGQDMMVGREDGRGDRAAFTGFVGITADASGFVYLLDKQPTEGRLRRVSPDGTVTTLVQGLPACLCTPTILPNGYARRRPCIVCVHEGRPHPLTLRAVGGGVASYLSNALCRPSTLLPARGLRLHFLLHPQPQPQLKLQLQLLHGRTGTSRWALAQSSSSWTWG